MKEIIDELKFQGVKNIDNYLPFPKSYIGKGPIKAIVLGADPSTKEQIRFDTVFGLLGEDKRYFAGINRNLDAVGLTLDNVYVQNLCQNYFTKTTYEQKANWWRASGVWYTFLRNELEELFDDTVPILATSEIILKRFVHFDQEPPNYYYNNPDILPLDAGLYTSKRMVLPFYRHWRYNLNKEEWTLYRNKIKSIFKDNLIFS